MMGRVHIWREFQIKKKRCRDTRKQISPTGQKKKQLLMKGMKKNKEEWLKIVDSKAGTVGCCTHMAVM